MLSNAEKTRILHNTRLLGDAPESALAHLADVLEVCLATPGERLVTRGDPGDCMYIIAAGRVSVHDEDLVFNELGPGDVFGELAVLDAETRSASVTAITDTFMLKLGQEPLYALLAEQPAVTRGVIHVLCRHLRNRVRDIADDFVYMRQFSLVTRAARSLESGSYDADVLTEVAARDDDLGQLARTFQRMAAEVRAREHRLRRQIQDLRIEIDRTRQDRQVAEITESDYFQRLRRSAAALRQSFEHGGDERKEAGSPADFEI